LKQKKRRTIVLILPNREKLHEEDTKRKTRNTMHS
jgi:hypothetical protein